jgi:hypothetical protein
LGVSWHRRRAHRLDFLDHASVRSNWISLAVEIVFGVILVL